MRSHYPVARAESQEIIESLVGEPDYNAYEKDIAVVNIFFGKPTTIGSNYYHVQILCCDVQSTRESRG